MGGALTGWLAGTIAPRPGEWLLFRETQWSYRRPISYDVIAPSGAVVAVIAPVDAATRTTSSVHVGRVLTLVLTIHRGGGTVVSYPAGAEVGRYRPMWALTAWRLAVIAGGRQVATLDQAALSQDAVVTTSPGGEPVARVVRKAGVRFAGASASWLQLGEAAAAVPTSLLVAAVPALDVLRRERRRRQWQ